ncbi:hypothetical protein [Collimonas arenae]|uniref:hypothetical protein n=1 Tax=Collimonas arenae TaxID=279058 RepID=UPI00056E38DF|nr:hypothetical protein [Collimonas arenae]
MVNKMPPPIDDWESKLAEVPDDFPHVGITSAIGGFQNKLALTGRDEKYYTSGNAPTERYQQWCTCEDLVQQYATQYRQAKAGEHSHIAAEDLLREHHEVATKAGWGLSIEQLKYVFRQVTSQLGLPSPELQDRPWYPSSVHVDDSIVEEFNKRMNSLPQTKSALQKMLEQRLRAINKSR